MRILLRGVGLRSLPLGSRTACRSVRCRLCRHLVTALPAHTVRACRELQPAGQGPLSGGLTGRTMHHHHSRACPYHLARGVLDCSCSASCPCAAPVNWPQRAQPPTTLPTAIGVSRSTFTVHAVSYPKRCISCTHSPAGTTPQAAICPHAPRDRECLCMLVFVMHL